MKLIDHTEKTVSLNQRIISLIYGQRKHFFESKKVLLIQTKFWSQEIDMFTLKKIFLNQQNFLQFKEIFSLTLNQRNVSLIQRNCFLGVKLTYLIYKALFCTSNIWIKGSYYKEIMCHILKTVYTEKVFISIFTRVFFNLGASISLWEFFSLKIRNFGRMIWNFSINFSKV